ncbi:hypothetical protein ACOMHN_016041 [Nucella lapillus]
MLLPDVVDTILEFLDGDTLLTSRLVCQRWKTAISQRKGLWRRRCELLGAHKPTFAPETDFFSMYMGLKRMLGQISRGEGWRADDVCDASQCLLRDHLAKCNDIIEREGREDWISNFVPDFMVKQRMEMKIILNTRHGELVVLDDEEKKVAWRTERNTTAYYILYKDVIFTITLLGNIEVYSWDGRCAVTDTGGKLQGVQQIHVDRTNLFLLVLLRDGRVFLVDDERPMLPLHLPSPPLPEPRDGEESAAAQPIDGVQTRVNVDHSGDDGERQLAVIAERQSSMSFVTFTQTGDVLHHLFLKFDRLFGLSPALEAGEGRYRLVSLNGRQVVARSVHISSKGISVEQLWKRTVPAALQPRVLVAGQKFLICIDGSAFQVYRMDDGTLVADFSAFLNGIDKAAQLVYNPDMIEHERGSDMMCILNYDWLDGLSASTMRPDYPVAVMFSTETPRALHFEFVIVCVRRYCYTFKSKKYMYVQDGDDNDEFVIVCVRRYCYTFKSKKYMYVQDGDDNDEFVIVCVRRYCYTFKSKKYMYVQDGDDNDEFVIVCVRRYCYTFKSKKYMYVQDGDDNDEFVIVCVRCYCYTFKSKKYMYVQDGDDNDEFVIVCVRRYCYTFKSKKYMYVQDGDDNDEFVIVCVRRYCYTFKSKKYMYVQDGDDNDEFVIVCVRLYCYTFKSKKYMYVQDGDDNDEFVIVCVRRYCYTFKSKKYMFSTVNYYAQPVPRAGKKSPKVS